MVNKVSERLVGKYAIPPNMVLKTTMLLLLVLLIVLPLLQAVTVTLQGGGASAWSEVLAGKLSRNLFYRPLGNTMVLGVGVAAGCVLLGGFLAWLVVMTDVLSGAPSG